jgi:hypothetical protein
MSQYEKKLEKLEELAGTVQCAHENQLVMKSPPWFTPEGVQPSALIKQCMDCGRNLLGSVV